MGGVLGVRRWSWLGLLAVVVCVLVAAGCGSSSSGGSSSGGSRVGGSSGAGPVVIGLGETVIPGVYDSSGPMQAGVAAAEGYIDAHGGWGGRSVDLVTCTSPGDPTSDGECYQKVIAAHATAMLGLMSYNAEYLPLLAKAGIPDFVFTDSQQEEQSSWEVQTSPSGAEAYTVGARYACAKGYTNVSVLNEDLPTSRLDEAVFAAGIFRACGIRVNNVYRPLTTADPSPYIQKAIGTHPQLLIIPGLTVPELTLVAAIRAAGYPVGRVIGVTDATSGWLSDPATAGILIMSPGTYPVPQNSDPAAQVFLQAMKKYSPGTNVLLDNLPQTLFQMVMAIWEAGKAIGFAHLNGTTLHKYMNSQAPGHLQIFGSHVVVLPPGLPGVKEPYTEIFQWTGRKLVDLGWYAGDWGCTSQATCASTTPPAGSTG
jgi:branched-chain amino acid transport system substrate-binding protein